MELLNDQFYDVNMELADANEVIAGHQAAQQEAQQVQEEEDPEEMEGVSSMDFEGTPPQPPTAAAHSPAVSIDSVGNLDDV